LLLTLCPMTNDPENLGLIIRTSAAFGAAAVLVGRAGADPFSRRVLRTSMGAVLDLPIITTSDWHAALAVLHQHAVQTMAAVVCQTAMPLSGTPRHARVALLMGNEDQGLPEELATMCRHRVTLPMTGGVGSLNVAVAAGILLHHFAAGAGEPACQPGAP
jgi:tRNA G18 (ribose-2'-O)-methylase SpoU